MKSRGVRVVFVCWRWPHRPAPAPPCGNSTSASPPRSRAPTTSSATRDTRWWRSPTSAPPGRLMSPRASPPTRGSRSRRDRRDHRAQAHGSARAAGTSEAQGVLESAVEAFSAFRQHRRQGARLRAGRPDTLGVGCHLRRGDSIARTSRQRRRHGARPRARGRRNRTRTTAAIETHRPRRGRGPRRAPDAGARPIPRAAERAADAEAGAAEEAVGRPPREAAP